MDGGCTWQTPQCGQITTVVEADLYVKIHSRECLFNPAVAEENTHRREAEAGEATARREAKAHREATESATLARREATEAEEPGSRGTT